MVSRVVVVVVRDVDSHTSSYSCFTVEQRCSFQEIALVDRAAKSLSGEILGSYYQIPIVLPKSSVYLTTDSVKYLLNGLIFGGKWRVVCIKLYKNCSSFIN